MVTWSRWAKRGYEEDGVDPSKVFVIPPPFPAVSDRKAHEGCNILFMGRDFARKGGDVAIGAFRKLDVPGCRMLYVGRVDAEGQRKLVREDPRIVHLDRPSGKELGEEVWPVIDIMALPTRADAFAVTVVDAMRRGIPVVTTRLPAIAEAVEDGRSGFLSAPGDEAGFSEGLRKLAGDGELRRRMGAEAQRRAKSLFSPEVVNERLAAVYGRAWRRPEGRAPSTPSEGGGAG